MRGDFKFAVAKRVLNPGHLELSTWMLTAKLLRLLTDGQRGVNIPLHSTVKTLRTRCDSGRIFERCFVSICSILMSVLILPHIRLIQIPEFLDIICGGLVFFRSTAGFVFRLILCALNETLDARVCRILSLSFLRKLIVELVDFFLLAVRHLLRLA